jgi:hypothetical protein
LTKKPIPRLDSSTIASLRFRQRMGRHEYSDSDDLEIECGHEDDNGSAPHGDLPFDLKREVRDAKGENTAGNDSNKNTKLEFQHGNQNDRISGSFFLCLLILSTE